MGLTEILGKDTRKTALSEHPVLWSRHNNVILFYAFLLRGRGGLQQIQGYSEHQSKYNSKVRPGSVWKSPRDQNAQNPPHALLPRNPSYRGEQWSFHKWPQLSKTFHALHLYHTTFSHRKISAARESQFAMQWSFHQSSHTNGKVVRDTTESVARDVRALSLLNYQLHPPIVVIGRFLAPAIPYISPWPPRAARLPSTAALTKTDISASERPPAHQEGKQKQAYVAQAVMAK